ncbi:hypothetical protein HW555_013477 [Spodoptera exigua]|uniref:C2H2-type domain-containing protein n=1 Tax=Spodoptera exigua TaxID=7107 RepID=A0A835G511_SPOEX|nr:hypothetical protein HW555_013477 [Spodoptera exigua]
MDLEENILPKTVCFLCIKSLEQAFKFICAVDEAQAYLSDFVMVKCTDKDLDKGVSYELVGSDNNAPKTFECAQDPMEISVKDGYSNDQVKCEIDSEEDCNDYTYQEQLENKKFESLIGNECIKIDDNVTDLTNIEPIKSMINIPDNNITNNSNMASTIHENLTDLDVHCTYQNAKSEEFDSNASEMLEDLQNTNLKKINKKLKLKKTTEAKSVANTESYSENYVSELIKSLRYVPEQYITNTWQDYLWQCSYCETQFTSMENLQKHSMDVHNSFKDDIVKCKGECGNVYHKKCVNKKFLNNAFCDDCQINKCSPKQCAEDAKITLNPREESGENVLAEVNKKLAVIYNLEKKIEELANSVEFYADMYISA